MTIEQVQNIAAFASHEGLSDSTVFRLRALFPEIHLTYCMDDDVFGAVPFLQYPGMNVYLVDGRQHCPALSADLGSATGVVLAEVIDN